MFLKIKSCLLHLFGIIFDLVIQVFPDEDVIAVTKLCGIYEDIMQMPDGLILWLGERGVSLSGGQKQRLAMSCVDSQS